MSTGLYIHRSRRAGEIVDAPMYNGAHQNQLQNDIPVEAGAHSDDVTQFRATTDPTTGDGLTALPADALSVELEQLRFVINDIKTVLNGGVPPTWWYTPITPTAATVVAHGARVQRTTNQLIPVSAQTAISFDNAIYDTGVVNALFDPFWTIAQPTRLTAKKTGLYEINGQGEWNTGVTSGQLMLSIRRNGSQTIAVTQQAVDGQAASRDQQVSCQYMLNEGDYVELVAFQTMFSPTFAFIGAEFGLELIGATSATTPVPTFTLNTFEAGVGTGTITSSPGIINCPGVCTETFVSGVMVDLTATPTNSVFSSWSGDVPIGHETDNPLTITMDQDRNITANFDSYGAYLTVDTNGPGSTFTMSTVNIYSDLGRGAAATATVGNAQRLMPAEITVTDIYVEVNPVQAAGRSCDLSFNINGVTNTTLKVTIDSSGTSFVSTGSPVTLALDDLVCWEISNFAGGFASVNIAHISFKYKVAVGGGFVLGRSQYLANSGNSQVHCFGASVGTGLDNTAWIPVNVHVDQLTIVANSATGAGTETRLQLYTNSNTSPQGSIVSLVDPATSVRGTINATAPGTSTGAAADNDIFRRSSVGSPGGVNVRHMFSYQTDTPNEGMSFYDTGRAGFNVTIGAGTVFMPIFGFNTAGAPPATEAAARMKWPLSGKFKLMGAVGNADIGTTVSVTLRVNGVDTALTFTFTGNLSQFQNDYVNEVSVVAGDYVDLRCTRDSGAGTGFVYNGFIAFVPA